MRFKILLIVLLIPIIFAELGPSLDLAQKALRGEFHDEGRLAVDYEDFSHNLTDYASRRVSDDDKTAHGESEIHTDSSDTSDISEERDRDVVDSENLQSINALKQGKKPEPIVTVINKAFNDRKTFSCPRIKDELLTGTSFDDVSPEDIMIISAMGDALATGAGLWPNADIEFRGASFPIGGDSTIDGLVTIPNILREFNPKLMGVSHGMGANLPDYQLNVASTGATTKDLPAQAKELVRRLKKISEVRYENEWVMVIITIGTEELCYNCRGPTIEPIYEAMKYLQIHIPKALVVLLGPVHVSSFHEQKANLLKSRCACSKNQTEGFMYDLSREWAKAWRKVEDYVRNGETSRSTFGIVIFPMITITSRYPSGLFIRDRPLLNRRGHNYATKWLWNRLIGGDRYNLSSATLSQDNYFCPSVGCPYFRTYANENRCRTTSYDEAREMELVIKSGTIIKKPRRTRHFLYATACIIFTVAFITVFLIATILYQWSKMDAHGRFEIVDEPKKKLEEAQKEEAKALLTRQNTRAQSELIQGNLQFQPILAGRNKSFRETIEDDSND